MRAFEVGDKVRFIYNEKYCDESIKRNGKIGKIKRRDTEWGVAPLDPTYDIFSIRFEDGDFLADVPEFYLELIVPVFKKEFRIKSLDSKIELKENSGKICHKEITKKDLLIVANEIKDFYKE